MKELKIVYKELNKFEKDGMLKAIKKYGVDGLRVLDYIYTEITVRNTEKRVETLKRVISWDRETFERISDIVE